VVEVVALNYQASEVVVEYFQMMAALVEVVECYLLNLQRYQHIEFLN
jgi:hypothetical protein